MISLFQKDISVSENIKDLLSVLLYISFITLSNDINGVFYMLILIVLIYLIHFKSYGFPVRIKLGVFHKYMLGVSLFCLFSSLWARNSNYADLDRFDISDSF